jgi:hypothetical protein
MSDGERVVRLANPVRSRTGLRRVTTLDASSFPERQVGQVEELVRRWVDGLTAWTVDAQLAYWVTAIREVR